jgi:hypothetical protein
VRVFDSDSDGRWVVQSALVSQSWQPPLWRRSGAALKRMFSTLKLVSSVRHCEWGARRLRLVREREGGSSLLVGLVLIYVKKPPQLFARAVLAADAKLATTSRVSTLLLALTGEGGMLERLLRLVTRPRDQGQPRPPQEVQDSIDAFNTAVPQWRTLAAATGASAGAGAGGAGAGAGAGATLTASAAPPSAATVLPPAVPTSTPMRELPPPLPAAVTTPAPSGDGVGTHRVWVFWNDVPGCEVYRAQLSGNCFMHAPDVVLHYVLCKHSPGDTSKYKLMVDLTAFLLKWFDGERFWRFVHDNNGGDSVWFLKQLGGLDGRDLLEMLASSPDEGTVVRHLHAHGPALIATFETFEGFGGHTTHSFVGADYRQSAGLHSMAMVGYRRDDAGGVRFLVQNWWQSKQFFECDLAFLASRRARLVWVTREPPMPNNPQTTDEVYEESYSGAEAGPEERM